MLLFLVRKEKGGNHSAWLSKSGVSLICGSDRSKQNIFPASSWGALLLCRCRWTKRRPRSAGIVQPYWRGGMSCSPWRGKLWGTPAITTPRDIQSEYSQTSWTVTIVETGISEVESHENLMKNQFYLLLEYYRSKCFIIFHSSLKNINSYLILLLFYLLIYSSTLNLRLMVYPNSY